MRWVRATGIVCSIVGICVFGCGGPATGPAQGDLGGACFPNNTCNAGLVCTLVSGNAVCEQSDASTDSPVTPEASPDAPIDAPATATGTHYHYVLASEHWPASNPEAQALGMDLDGDGQVDNQLGKALVALSGQGLDTQTTVDQQVATGAILMLADLQTTDFTTAVDAGFTLYTGADPSPTPCAGPSDTVCGHHLAGTGSFNVASVSPRDTPVLGNIASGTLTTGAGSLSPQLALVGSSPITLTLLGARAKVTATASGITQGVIAGGISANDLDTKLYPLMQQGFMAIVQRDCTQLGSPPACGCMANSQGAALITLFDNNPSDCAISTDEIKNNAIVQASFAPDVTLGGQPAVSLGFGFTAVTGTFTP
jgi:hypothetical protein